MLPICLRDSGALRLLTVAPLRVYIALVLEARWSEGGRVIIAQDGPGSLCEATGLDKGTIRKATRELERLGLVKVVQGRGRGRANEYQILRVKAGACACFLVEKGGAGDPFSAEKSRRMGPEKQAHQTVKAGACACPSEKTEKTESSSSARRTPSASPGADGKAGGGAAAAEAIEQDRKNKAREVLTSYGGGEPTRGRLVSRVHVTARAVVVAAKRLKDRGKLTPALLVLEVEGAADALAQADRAQVEAEAALDDRQLALLRALRRHWPQLRAANGWVARLDLTAEDVARAAAEAMRDGHVDLQRLGQILHTPRVLPRGGPERLRASRSLAQEIG